MLGLVGVGTEVRKSHRGRVGENIGLAAEAG